MFKIIVILRRKKGTTTEQFREHWKNIHGPLFKRFPEIKNYEQYYVTDKRRDDQDEPIDGVAILEFDSLEKMREAFSRPEYKDIPIDEKNFLEDSGAGVHVVYVDEMIKVM